MSNPSMLPTVRVQLDDDDIRMLSAFGAHRAVHPSRSPKRLEIENGFGEYRFPYVHLGPQPGPRTFDRLKLLGLIEHSRNGYCWLTPAGRNALEAALMGPSTAQPKRYQHRKRGTVYEVLGAGKLQTDLLLCDDAEVVIYRGEDGALWARPPDEFHDGRFRELEAPPTASMETSHG